MAVNIEPLLAKLSSMAPLFGRAEADIDAMVIRGRQGDYKGVMQNARLVLEALLRALVAEELKQTPGKAMLDELVTKFRQQANAGIVPTTVLAHMGTVQAWGNLSSHDHAGSLADQGVTVGEDEVVASLNSMVAILGWYAARKNLTPAPAAAARSSGPSPKKPPAVSTPLLAAVLIAAAVGVAALVALRTGGSRAGLEALDAVYATRKEPPPPAACRRPEEAGELARSATSLDALSLITEPSPEAAYLLARATFDGKKTRAPALDVALACPHFAAAHRLAARADIAEAQDAARQRSEARALVEQGRAEAQALVDALAATEQKKLEDARGHLEQVRADAPAFLEARAELAGVLLQLGRADAARAEADALIAAAPDFHPAFLVRFAVRSQAGERDAAREDLCTAVRLGSSQARAKAEALKLECGQ